VQIDLVWTEPKLANWQRYRMTPAQGVKGSAYGNLFSTLGQMLHLSIYGAGVQIKIKDGEPVEFAKERNPDKVETITTDIHNFALDLLKYMVKNIHPTAKLEIDPELASHPGIDPDAITPENLVASIRGLAKSFEANDLFGYRNLKDIPNYDAFITKFKNSYLARMTGAANAKKFEKAETPQAKARAEEVKARLLADAQKIADLL